MTMVIVDRKWAGADWTLKNAMRTKRFWCLVIAFGFGSYVYQGALLHAIPAMVDSGLSREMGAFYFGVLGICGAAGKILFGRLSDILGRERINALAGVVTIIGITCLMYLSILEGPIMPLLFAVAFGLGYGAAAPLFPSVSADIFLGGSFGAIFAMICVGSGLGGALGSYLSGWLFDTSGNYKLALLICNTAILISCLFIWIAGPRKVRKMVKTSKIKVECAGLHSNE